MKTGKLWLPLSFGAFAGNQGGQAGDGIRLASSPGPETEALLFQMRSVPGVSVSRRKTSLKLIAQE
jgi:hypothetical protein